MVLRGTAGQGLLAVDRLHVHPPGQGLSIHQSQSTHASLMAQHRAAWWKFIPVQRHGSCVSPRTEIKGGWEEQTRDIPSSASAWSSQAEQGEAGGTRGGRGWDAQAPGWSAPLRVEDWSQAQKSPSVL